MLYRISFCDNIPARFANNVIGQSVFIHDFYGVDVLQFLSNWESVIDRMKKIAIREP